MIISNVALAAGILAYTATAQLMLPPLFNIKSERSSSIFMHGAGDAKQRPLVGTQSSNSRNTGLPPYKAGQSMLIQQDNTTCATYGESQWTGTIDVTDTRRLFFWFFNSRSDPENDPIVIWLNGGPGSSSMTGLFNEMGPCWLDPGADSTVPNDFAWNNNVSILFIDQPAGVGFSSLADGAAVPSNDLGGAQDFQMFLNIFFSEVFPDRAHLPIHVAAESYGGHYAPVGNITSLILVDSVVDFTAPAVGAYELLCKDFRHAGPIVNETACEAIRLNIPEAEALGLNCEMSNDGHICWAMIKFTEETIHRYYDEEVSAGRRNPYNINLPCPDFPWCYDIAKSNITAYLNQGHIKKALGFPSSFTYENFNLAINQAYVYSRVPFGPTTREVAAILDAYRTPGLGDIRLLVLQGNADYVLNTPGNMWAYDNLRWSGQADHRITPWQELPEEVATTGFWKGTDDGRLVFVAVDGAGHMMPGDVREGAYRIAQGWIEGGWR